MSSDLNKEFTGLSGYSARNLWDMRRFYLEYKDNENLRQLVAEIPWGQISLLCLASKIIRKGENILACPIFGFPLKGKSFARLVFIDSVPGGAGHVARLMGKGSENPQVMMDAILKEAQSILNCKDCAENTACYSCLFHHRNQNIQHTLNRGLALEWINSL